MDADNEGAGFGGDGSGGEDELPPLPPPPPTHNHPHHFPPSAPAAAPQPASLASEAYLAVRDWLSASVAEARGDRSSAAAHAAAAASRVQTAVEAEGVLPRGDFGPVCDLLATAFAWKAQALSDALESGRTPADTAGVGAGFCPSPTLLSATLPPSLSLAAPPPPGTGARLPLASAARHPYHQHAARRPAAARQYSRRLPGDDEEEDPLADDLPPYPLNQPLAAAVAATNAQGGAANTNTTTNNNTNDSEDAALEAELVRRCVRRPPGLPADPSALSRVQGLRDVKRELEDALLLPLRLPPRLRRALRGVRRPPRTFLLHGPPGTGKTLLAEAAAAAAGACLLSASPSAVLSKWSGESERAVRLLFRAAERLAPCVVFLDEVDALGASRGGFAVGGGGGSGGGGSGGGGSGGEAAAGGNQDALARRVLTELLVQMSRLEEEKGGQGDESRPPVWVFAATNRPCDVDPALLRRFERRVAVPLPDAVGRAALVRAALRELDDDDKGAGGGDREGTGGGGGHALSEADVARVAGAMQGLSGADVRAVARRAALAPVRELGEEVRRRWGGEEGDGGRKRRRAEEEDDDDDDGSLRLRAVCAGDWDAALAALFGGGGGGGGGGEGGGGGGGADAAAG